ncbi:MAG: hypothetical protein WCZ17_08270, partial [Candidatus Kapaibacterium sp.]
MSIKSTISTKSLILIFLSFIILLTSVTDTEAARRRKRRSYNPKKTREQAIDIIRSTSEQISELAG